MTGNGGTLHPAFSQGLGRERREEKTEQKHGKTSVAIRSDAPYVDPLKDRSVALDGDVAVSVDLCNEKWSCLPGVKLARVGSDHKDLIADLIIVVSSSAVFSGCVSVDESLSFLLYRV